MWLLILGALIVAAPFVVASHQRRAASRLRSAHRAWDAVEKYGRVLLEDRHLDPELGDFVEFIIKKTGSGAMTRMFLGALVLPRALQSSEDSELSRLLAAASQEQEQNLYRLMVAAMLYDSLRTAFSGVLLRRVIYWMSAAATDKTVPVSRAQVQPMVSSADRLCHGHA